MLFPVDMADHSHSIWHHFRCTQDSRNLSNILYSHRLLWLYHPIQSKLDNQLHHHIFRLFHFDSDRLGIFVVLRYHHGNSSLVYTEIAPDLPCPSCCSNIRLYMSYSPLACFISISLCITRNRLKLVLGAVKPTGHGSGSAIPGLRNRPPKKILITW